MSEHNSVKINYRNGKVTRERPTKIATLVILIAVIGRVRVSSIRIVEST